MNLNALVRPTRSYSRERKRVIGSSGRVGQAESVVVVFLESTGTGVDRVEQNPRRTGRCYVPRVTRATCHSRVLR